MKIKFKTVALIILISLAVTGCFHSALKGSVAGATITISLLRSPNMVLHTVTSQTPADLISSLGTDKWQEFRSLVQMVAVGMAPLKPAGLNPNALYLVSATGGEDYDPQLQLILSNNPSSVQGTWHTIVSGARISEGNIQVSSLTEALYQQQIDIIDETSDTQIMARLNAAAYLLVDDIDENGEVDYNDALRWIRSLHADKFRGDIAAVDSLAGAVIAGQPNDMLNAKAKTALGNQRVAIMFDVGTVTVDTLNWDSPITAANFLSYVRSGFYDDMLVHRAIDNFMIQMGLVNFLGRDGNGAASFSLATPGANIVNESSNGLSNIRGTVAMARTNDPNSANSQFFINQRNINTFLDYGSSGNPDGYAVFARVVSGMAVVDDIAGEATVSVSGIGDDVPNRGVVLESMTLID
jgi:cyclophilin family peptidyl-prolyl cis-trans isomerase